MREVRSEKFSWLSRRILIESRNDQFAKYIYDIVRDERPRWIAAQRAVGADRDCPDWVIDRTGLGPFSAVIVGDPGEGDRSQLAVAKAIAKHDSETEFLVVLSDVVYPAGDVNQYVEKFYAPFEGYRGPIYALPGNHDWYDLLNGFMYHFCGAEPLPAVPHRSGSYPVRERVGRLLWRRSSRPDRMTLVGRRAKRPPWNEQPPRAPQPGPYWVLETEHVAFVAIDTGITGKLDHDQGKWLLRVSADVKKPKVLLTGKPLIVDSERKSCPIEWAEGSPEGPSSVDDIVADPDYDYVAALGGDVHNYQRYPVRVAGRRIEYVVSGGGGAFLSATHKIPNAAHLELPPDRAPVAEKETRLYPLRGDSLAYYSTELVRRSRRYLGFALSWLVVALLLAWLLASGFALPPWDGESLSERGWPLWGAGALVGIVGLFQLPYGLIGVAEHRWRVVAYAVGLMVLSGLIYLLDRPWRDELPLWAVFLVGGAILALYSPQRAQGARRNWRWFLPAMLSLALAILAAVLGWEVDPPLTLVLVVAPVVLPVLCVSLYGWRVRRFAGLLAALLAFVLVAWLVSGPTTIDETVRWLTGVALFFGAATFLGAPRARRPAGTEKVHVSTPDRSLAAWLAVVGILAAAALVGIFVWDVSMVLALIAAALGVLFFAYMLSLGLVRAAFSPRLRAKAADPDLLPRNASGFMARRIEERPVRPEARDLPRLDPDLAWLFERVFPKHTFWPFSPFHQFIAEILDADTAPEGPGGQPPPPLFKSYLTVEVRERDGEPELVIRAWGVNGIKVGERAPADEDVVIPLARPGATLPATMR